MTGFYENGRYVMQIVDRYDWGIVSPLKPAPLTADQIAKIKQLVEKEFKTSFEIVHEIDPSLLGGFVLNIGDRQFDASISTRLRALKNEFDSNPYVKQV